MDDKASLPKNKNYSISEFWDSENKTKNIYFSDFVPPFSKIGK